jgi:hypothetical protein
MMSHDVFISHATRDKAIADAACARLESRKIRCWIAPRDVRAGSNYAKELVQAIHSSRVMVLIFSANANGSDHVMREVDRAADRKIPIIPFRVDEVSPSGSFEYILAGVHWLDALTPPLERHIDVLCDEVGRLLGNSIAAPAQPPSQEETTSETIDGPTSREAAGAPGRARSRAATKRAGLALVLLAMLLAAGYGVWRISGAAKSPEQPGPVSSTDDPQKRVGGTPAVKAPDAAEKIASRRLGLTDRDTASPQLAPPSQPTPATPGPKSSATEKEPQIEAADLQKTAWGQINPALFGNSRVQAELKLDATQADKAQKAADVYREKLRERFQSLQDVEGDERTRKHREVSRETYGDAYKEASRFLTPEQMKRLTGIHLQSQGAQALAHDENVQRYLALTAPQKENMNTLVQFATEELREIVQKREGDRDAMRARVAEHRKETLAKAEAFLTGAQKAKWRMLLGAPFEVTLGRGFGNP